MSATDLEPRKSPVYEAAKREYNDNVGEARANARVWRNAWAGTFALCLASIVGNYYQAVTAHVVTLVEQVNKLGESVVVKELVASAPFDPDRIEPQLSRFVHDVFTVLPNDDIGQRDLVNEAYAWVDAKTDAIQDLNHHYIAHQPNVLGQTEHDDVTIEDVLPHTGGKLWTIDYYVDVAPFNKPPVRTYYRMDVEIKEMAPRKKEEAMKNPGHFYIEHWHFSPRPGTPS